jgi:hypothetical protein
MQNVVTGQDTDTSGCASTEAAGLQAPLSSTVAPPVALTATQNVAEGHETELRDWPEAIVLGVQDPPA